MFEYDSCAHNTYHLHLRNGSGGAGVDRESGEGSLSALVQKESVMIQCYSDISLTACSTSFIDMPAGRCGEFGSGGGEGRTSEQSVKVVGSVPSWPIASKMNWKRFWSLAWSAAGGVSYIRRISHSRLRTAEGLPLARGAVITSELLI